MSKTKVALAALAALLLVPVVMSAGRLDGLFATDDDEQGNKNQACIQVTGPEFLVDGTVTGADGNCVGSIRYSTPFPHSASATALKAGKTEGSAKVSQSIDAEVEVTVAGTGCGANAMTAVADSEKCKVSASMKGTAGATDSLDSARVSVSCELGDGGANLDTVPATSTIQAPNSGQFTALVNSFAGRKDVKLDSKGKLKITLSGGRDTVSPAEGDCTVATTTTTSSTTTTTAGPTTTTGAPTTTTAAPTTTTTPTTTSTTSTT